MRSPLGRRLALCALNTRFHQTGNRRSKRRQFPRPDVREQNALGHFHLSPDHVLPFRLGTRVKQRALPQSSWSEGGRLWGRGSRATRGDRRQHLGGRLCPEHGGLQSAQQAASAGGMKGREPGSRKRGTLEKNVDRNQICSFGDFARIHLLCSNLPEIL